MFWVLSTKTKPWKCGTKGTVTWLHEGAGKTHLVIKNSAHTARIVLLQRLFPRARFVYLHRRPIDSVRSLVQVKQRLAHLVGLQEPLSSLQQVEETAAAHDQLQEAFARSRPLIPKGQLVEVAYEDLVQSPLNMLQRIVQEQGELFAQRVKHVAKEEQQRAREDDAARALLVL